MKTAEIVCVLDRSGSMYSIVDDAIGGFNTFLKEQSDANITIVLFNDKVETFYDGPVEDAPLLNKTTFVPDGTTSLLDALGSTIDKIGQKLDKMEDKPEKVIFVILTDGQENTSREYTHSQVSDKIAHQQDVYSWNFIFLAANQDAFQTGMRMSIDPQYTQNFDFTGAGIRAAYNYASQTNTAIRSEDTVSSSQ